jgi:hypothetical protein
MWNCTYDSLCFCIIFKTKHKKCSFAQYMKEFKWIELWILKEIGQSAMRAQVATFAGCPMPSQFERRQAPKKLLTNHTHLRMITQRHQTGRIRCCARGMFYGKSRIIYALSLMNFAWFFFQWNVGVTSVKHLSYVCYNRQWKVESRLWTR